MSKIRVVNLDVHADIIAVAVAELDGESPLARRHPEPVGIDTQTGSETRAGRASVGIYEAGPTGYIVYWQLTALKVAWEVIAPTLVPSKPATG